MKGLIHFRLFHLLVQSGVVLFMGIIPVFGRGKVHKDLKIRKYEWSMAAPKYYRTPGGDSVFAAPYNEIWHYNVDSLCYHVVTDRNSFYTQELLYYHIWIVTIYTSEKQLDELFNKMKAAAKRYNYPLLGIEADYLRIFLPLYSSLHQNGKVTKEDLDDVLDKMQKYNTRFYKNNRTKRLAFLCHSYRLCRLADHNERMFKYIPAILHLQEQVNTKNNLHYYYLYYFVGNDFFRFGDRERGVYYLKKALHDKPLYFSDRADLRARATIAEYYAEINQLDSSDYYFRSLYDSRQDVRFRPIYDMIAAGGIACNLVKRNRYDEALPVLEHWLPEAERIKTYSMLFNMYSAACKCYIQKEQFSQAKAMIDSLRNLRTYLNNNDIIMEAIPKNNIPTENLYELIMFYFLNAGKSAEAWQYLDSIRIERNHRKQKQNPLLILQAELEFFENEKSNINRNAKLYMRSNHILSVILALTLASLLISIYFYKKKQKTYRNLAHKNEEWAKESALETLATEEEFDLIRRAHGLMSEGLFRDSELSLDSLAEKLSIHRNILSRAINRVTGKRFNLFINEYRVKEAIRMIENAPRENKNLYIDGLYQDLGFNSPASFFRIFKQITGLSPGAFFRQVCNEDK